MPSSEMFVLKNFLLIEACLARRRFKVPTKIGEIY